LIRNGDLIRLITYLQRYQTRGAKAREVVFEDGNSGLDRKRKVSDTGVEARKRKSGGIVQLLENLAIAPKGNASALECILSSRIGWMGGDVGFVEACDALFSVVLVSFLNNG
jgi:hypothetical protein